MFNPLMSFMFFFLSWEIKQNLENYHCVAKREKSSMQGSGDL